MASWPNGVAVRSVPANGINFSVATSGVGDRLVLLLHGFPESSWSWRHQIASLASAGNEVWAPDLRGYGNTARPSGVASYALEVLIDDVVGLVEASGRRNAVVVGHDWGGNLAWYVAMRRPDIIERLGVMNAPHPACFDRELRNWRQLMRLHYLGLFQVPRVPEWLFGANDAWAIGRIVQRLGVDEQTFDADTIRHYRQQASQEGALTAMLNYYRASVRGGGAKRQSELGYPAIETPTLVIWGTKDSVLIEDNLKRFDDYVRNLTVVRIVNAGHFVQEDQPQAVNSELLTWLGS